MNQIEQNRDTSYIDSKTIKRSQFIYLFSHLVIAEEIRLYFGEAIALYFTFLGFYTTALFVPLVLGFLQLLLSVETVPFFCIFNVIWVTVFLEVSNLTWRLLCLVTRKIT